eukprot:m.8981 g.8981  ORF g.8981 m.8981 type:complete len:567 (-) comp3986_c0_seq2:183-1883(-)
MDENKVEGLVVNGWDFTRDSGRHNSNNAGESITGDVLNNDASQESVNEAASQIENIEDVESGGKSVAISAFSSNEEEVIKRSVSSESCQEDEEINIEEVYELERCAAYIISHAMKEVALQFPDFLLKHSTMVADELRARAPGSHVFILADTVYGSCCVDEVAAEHAKAELLIHYGPSCLSQPPKLPVLYVFGKSSIGLQYCASAISTFLEEDAETKVVLLFDVVYNHAIDYLSLAMAKFKERIYIPALAMPDLNKDGKECAQEPNDGGDSDETPKADKDTELTTESNNLTTLYGRKFTLSSSELKDRVFIYLGNPSQTLSNMMLRFHENKFLILNAVTGMLSPASQTSNKTLMRRYYMMQKAKDARVVGLLAGTLGVANYLETMTCLQKLCDRAGKKTYTFAMGKLNPAKLANFMEIDVFVLIACPENSLLESKDFYRPIVTPYELEAACMRKLDWPDTYELDFRKLLPTLKEDLENENPFEADEEADFSVITGTYRSYGGTMAPEDSGKQVAIANKDSTVALLPSAQHLANRTFSGLERKLGETPVTKAVQGKSGIAASYEGEES